MEITIQEISPEAAAMMLENNPANRVVNKAHVAAIARDMKAGAWQVNGDAIRLNCDGSLIDGQHRLTACVVANVPFRSVVITGLDADVRATIDSGRKRTHADRLSMRGVANAKAVSATARMIGVLALGQIVWRPTSHELDQVIKTNPGLLESVSHHKGDFPGMGTILPALHYIGGQIGQEYQSEKFCEVFRHGIPAYPGCASHALRERIIANREKLTAYGGDDLLRASVVCFRHFLTQTPVRQIKLGDDMRIKGWTPDRLGI